MGCDMMRCDDCGNLIFGNDDNHVCIEKQVKRLKAVVRRLSGFLRSDTIIVEKLNEALAEADAVLK